MSEVEYNSLLYRISKRLDEINVLEHILFMCRGKLANRADDTIRDTLSLFTKLEESSFLGVDSLQVLKDIVKAVNQWDLQEEIVKFESIRGEYKKFVERVIGVLEELNDLERLMSAVWRRRRRIPEERKNDVHDVRSLVQVLEGMNFLGIDCLDLFREIFIELNNDELLTELEEFQNRRTEHEAHERRKAQRAAIWSYPGTVCQKIIGAIQVHATFLSGTVMLAIGIGPMLWKSSTFTEYVQGFNKILPWATKLLGLGEASVCFMVQAETSLALEELYKRYSTGRLQRDLQEFLVTDDIRKLADGGEVVVHVYVDEKEFRKARDDLINTAKDLVSSKQKDGQSERLDMLSKKMDMVFEKVDKFLLSSEGKVAPAVEQEAKKSELDMCPGCGKKLAESTIKKHLQEGCPERKEKDRSGEDFEEKKSGLDERSEDNVSVKKRPQAGVSLMRSVKKTRV